MKTERVHDGTKQKLMGEVPGLREISAEEVELGQEWTKVEAWRQTDVAESGVTQKAASGSRSSKAQGDLLLSQVEFFKIFGGRSDISWPSQGVAAEAKSSKKVLSRRRRKTTSQRHC